MENPASWHQAEHLISEAIKEWEAGQKVHVVGLSLPMTIANKLREAGFDLGDL